MRLPRIYADIICVMKALSRARFKLSSYQSDDENRSESVVQIETQCAVKSAKINALT